MLTVSACSHTFHIDCIAKWTKINPKCPCCRAPLPDEIDTTLSKLRKMNVSDIFSNVIFNPLGITHPLCLIFLILMLETFLFGPAVIFFFFYVFYHIYEDDAISATCSSFTICILSPLFFSVAVAALILQIFYLLYWTLKFYATVFMCKIYCSDAFGFIVERTITLTYRFFD